eukprot:5913316-Lingulodinium_polyedra.AAC.1
MDCPWAAHRQSMANPETVLGQSMDWPWTEQLMDWPWTVHGLAMVNPWAIHGQSMGTSRSVHNGEALD